MKNSKETNLINFYLKHIKRNMICPACGGKLIINKDKTVWECNKCSYTLLNSDFENNYVFWFCDECGEFLNVQNGFDSKSEKWICTNCGTENNITPAQVKDICIKCGKISDTTTFGLCDDCFKEMKSKIAKGIRIIIETTPFVIAAFEGLRSIANTSKDNEPNDGEDKKLLSDNISDKYPICNSCGASMTEFDGWAWYTCPECGNSVRIIDGETTWHNEIFGPSSNGKKCAQCGRNMAGGEYVPPWANGSNKDGYTKCPHCGYVNFDWDD